MLLAVEQLRAVKVYLEAGFFLLASFFHSLRDHKLLVKQHGVRLIGQLLQRLEKRVALASLEQIGH